MSQEARERSFDELASGLASGSISRGKALRLMGAALVGGTLASLGIGEAAAARRCKQAGKHCKNDEQCCNGDCAGGTCSACPAGRVLLANGTCAKPCTSGVDCPLCSLFCRQDSGLDVSYCSGGIATPFQGCPNGDIDCPEGQFCQFGLGDPDICAVAC